MRAMFTRSFTLLDHSTPAREHANSRTALGLVGIQPSSQPSISLSIEVKAGYVIDLRDDDEIQAKVIDHV